MYEKIDRLVLKNTKIVKRTSSVKSRILEHILFCTLYRSYLFYADPNSHSMGRVIMVALLLTTTIKQKFQ